MEISSATRAVNTQPPKVRPPDNNRAQAYQAEQQKSAQRAQQQQQAQKAPPVVNTQGQTTGRIVNTKA